MILVDKIVQAAQSLINKDQRSSIKPTEINSFANIAMSDIMDDIHITIQNDKLGILFGKQDMERLKYSQEALNFFYKPGTLTKSGDFYTKPIDLAQIDDLFYLNGRIEKAKNMKHINLLRRMGKHLSFEDSDGLAPQIYYYLETDSGYQIYPNSFNKDIDIVYWRNYNEPKWTYNVVNGTAIYDGSKGDAQNFELPQRFFDDLVYRITILAGINLKDTRSVQPLFGIKKEEERENIS